MFSSERVLTALHVGHNKTEDPQNLVKGAWAPKSKMTDPGVSTLDIILDPIDSGSEPAGEGWECWPQFSRC